MIFEAKDLTRLYKPPTDSSGEDNGQVTIIAGSELFHGAPMLATTVASRIVDMVFFSSPYEPLKDIADKVKSELFSFIWVPFSEIEKYIEKSDAILIGPGFMRFANENTEQKTLGRMRSFIGRSHEDRVGKKTRKITEYLLSKFPHKKWVIDGGSLQVMDANWIPEGSIITPNKKGNTGTMESYRQLKLAARNDNHHYLYETTVGAGTEDWPE
jgi:NAD(P)H-hydrate repair Nnr-like enzyme with NAD(P)H-hydrate dehydratase domain